MKNFKFGQKLLYTGYTQKIKIVNNPDGSVSRFVVKYNEKFYDTINKLSKD